MSSLSMGTGGQYERSAIWKRFSTQWQSSFVFVNKNCIDTKHRMFQIQIPTSFHVNIGAYNANTGVSISYTFAIFTLVAAIWIQIPPKEIPHMKNMLFERTSATMY